MKPFAILMIGCCAVVRAGSIDKPEPVAISALLAQGSQLSPGQVHELELRLVKDERDLAARVPLLAHHTERASAGDPRAKADRRRHLLWLIRHQPALDVMTTPWAAVDARIDPELFARGRGVWQTHLESQPSNPVILAHAAAFLSISDPAVAHRLLDKAESLDPTHPLWPRLKSDLHARRMRDSGGEPRRQEADKALTELREAQGRLASDEQRRFLLADLGALALEAGRLVEARRCGDDMIRFAVDHPADPHAPVLWHRGHVLLGRVALAASAPESAKLHLMESAKLYRPSARLAAQGPDLSLAQVLLERGERAMVMEYLQAVSVWWKHDDGRLLQWKQALRAGRKPEFISSASR